MEVGSKWPWWTPGGIPLEVGFVCVDCGCKGEKKGRDRIGEDNGRQPITHHP